MAKDFLSGNCLTFPLWGGRKHTATPPPPFHPSRVHCPLSLKSPSFIKALLPIKAPKSQARITPLCKINHTHFCKSWSLYCRNKNWRYSTSLFSQLFIRKLCMLDSGTKVTLKNLVTTSPPRSLLTSPVFMGGEGPRVGVRDKVWYSLITLTWNLQHHSNYIFFTFIFQCTIVMYLFCYNLLCCAFR